jgi:cell division protein FtsL
MAKPGIEEVTRRLETLARLNKVWMIISAALFVLIIGFIVAEKFTPLVVPREVAAHKIVLKDNAGINRARMYVDDLGAVLKIADEQGLTRTTLGVTDYGTSSLRMMDHKGNTRVILGVLTNALPGLYLKDVNRKTRAGLVVLPTTEPVMFIKDDSSRTLWRAP